MTRQQLMWVLWPSFLLAGALETLVFSVVDPADLQWPDLMVDLSRQGVYTLAFFVFWVITASSSALTIFLAQLPPRKGG